MIGRSRYSASPKYSLWWTERSSTRETYQKFETTPGIRTDEGNPSLVTKCTTMINKHFPSRYEIFPATKHGSTRGQER